jgi:hypothetical protein
MNTIGARWKNPAAATRPVPKGSRWHVVSALSGREPPDNWR